MAVLDPHDANDSPGRGGDSEVEIDARFGGVGEQFLSVHVGFMPRFRRDYAPIRGCSIVDNR